MKILDAHTHAFPDSLADRAIAALEAECEWKAVSDGRVGSLLAAMDQAGVDKAIVCMIATKPDQADKILEFCRHIASDRLLPFPSVHPLADDAPQQVARIAQAGFAGIKLHPQYQGFALDCPPADPLFAAVEEHDLLVTCHCGLDIAFPPDDDRASPARIAALLDRRPKLKFLATHLGGWKNWDDVLDHLAGRGVYAECSFSLQYLQPDRAMEVIQALGFDRVLFGTDWPWYGMEDYLGMLNALPLSDAQRRAICYDNAAALLGLDE
jgi:predicted TIM-barrel fold metal-dependent hydrolase